MSDELPETGFSADYVKQLREENASWRKKVRELEAHKTQSEVAVEFAKRGVNADPSWLRIPEGVSAQEAVDAFLSSFGTPAAPEEDHSPLPSAPAALIPNPSKANVPGPAASGAILGGRSLNEIKEDPKARQMLREQYRAMLRDQSHQGNNNY